MRRFLHRCCLITPLLVLLVPTSALAAPFDWTTGFTTDYTLSIDLWDPGTYALGSSAFGHHPLWDTGGDATGDSLFLLVNGREDRTNALVWGMTLDLGADPFVVYAKNLCCTDHQGRAGADLGFYVDGNLIGDIPTDGTGVWQAFSFLPLVLPGIHTYEIRDGSEVYDGNDFGLDFQQTDPVPEPATLVMFGTGLLGLVGLWRKSRKAAPTLVRF